MTDDDLKWCDDVVMTDAEFDAYCEQRLADSAALSAALSERK